MNFSISDEVLSMLVCPESGQALRLAGSDELDDWSAPVPFEGALVTVDGSRAYPVRDGIPHLVASEALVRKKSAGG